MGQRLGYLQSTPTRRAALSEVCNPYAAEACIAQPDWMRRRFSHLRYYCLGATYSLGSSPPVPKKNSFICSTRNSCASRVQGCRRYSLSSIFWRSTHSPQAFLETFL